MGLCGNALVLAAIYLKSGLIDFRILDAFKCAVNCYFCYHPLIHLLTKCSLKILFKTFSCYALPTWFGVKFTTQI